MKNITLSVDEDVLDAVRVIAAQRKTSVNMLVREYLESLTRQQARAKEAMARLRALSEKSQAGLGPDYVFDRDSLHER